VNWTRGGEPFTRGREKVRDPSALPEKEKKGRISSVILLLQKRGVDPRHVPGGGEGGKKVLDERARKDLVAEPEERKEKERQLLAPQKQLQLPSSSRRGFPSAGEKKEKTTHGVPLRQQESPEKEGGKREMFFFRPPTKAGSSGGKTHVASFVVLRYKEGKRSHEVEASGL